MITGMHHHAQPEIILLTCWNLDFNDPGVWYKGWGKNEANQDSLIIFTLQHVKALNVVLDMSKVFSERYLVPLLLPGMPSFTLQRVGHILVKHRNKWGFEKKGIGP